MSLPSLGSSATLLAVDDRQDNLFVLEQLVAGGLPECKLITATSAAEGLAIAARTPLDGALIDVQMPEMDGVEMCRRLKADAATRNVHVILVTAHEAGAELKAKGLNAGADDFINKPIDNAELVARINVMLRVKRAEDELRRMNEHLDELVTERTRKLRESRAELYAIYHNAPLVMILVDRERRVQKVNYVASRFAQRAAEDMIGLYGGEALRCVHSADNPKGCGFGAACGSCPVRGLVVDTFETGNNHFREEATLRLTTREEDVVLLISSALLTLAEGMRVLVSIEDITERKLAEEKLRQSEERYHQLFATMLDGFALHEIICDETGNPVDYRFLEANPAFEDLTGLRDRDIVGKTALEVLPELERFWINTCGEVALSGRPARFGHYERQLEKHLEVLAFSPRHGQFAVVFTDVTKRVQMEEQLRQSQKMEAIGQLAGGVAHDFNNILTGITGYTELTLAQLSEDSPQASDLNEVLALADRASNLTRQLLAFGRRQALEPVVLDLNGLVENMLKMLPRLIGEDIELRFVPGHDLGNVRADPGQVEQVLMNLAVNARDAMPGGGALTVETANVELDEAQAAAFEGDSRPGPYVLLSVADTGCGMDEATLGRAFEPFFTTKEVGKGTGLGLSTVLGIVKQHEGNIGVQSIPGQGARFEIYLPRVDDGVGARRTELPGEEPRKGSETILVVEDEGSVREVATRYLEAQGYTVLAAASPREAEELFAQRRDEVALLLADVVLPGRNGREMYERLAESRPSLEVLYMSGYAGDAIAHRGVVAPDTAFVQKPFTQEELARKVGEVLDAKAAGSPTH